MSTRKADFEREKIIKMKGKWIKYNISDVLWENTRFVLMWAMVYFKRANIVLKKHYRPTEAHILLGPLESVQTWRSFRFSRLNTYGKTLQTQSVDCGFRTRTRSSQIADDLNNRTNIVVLQGNCRDWLL